MATTSTTERRWGARALWFAGIYLGSIGGLGLVAWALRAWLHG